MRNLSIFTQPKKSIRNPNIDFIRIAGMFAIVIDHLLFHGNAIKIYKKYKELQFLNILCMWHVCSFGIISGLVGSNSHRFSNLFYLWILAVFYSLLFYFIFNNLKIPIFNKNLIGNLFPVIFHKYWYFTCYFGSYPFFQFANSGISSISQIQVKKSIYFMIGIFIIWSSYYPDTFSQNNGHTPFSLLIFYIFGSYIGKYIFFIKHSIIYRILISALCFLLFMIISFSCYNINIGNSIFLNNPKIKNIFRIEINSFPMVFQAFLIIFFVAQIKFDKYISKIITFIGPLTFDVYLIHENEYIRSNIIRKSFNNDSKDLNLSIILLIIVKKAIIIFNICIFIAYLRSIIFKIIKIKNISQNFEIIITKIINYFI